MTVRRKPKHPGGRPLRLPGGSPTVMTVRVDASEKAAWAAWAAAHGTTVAELIRTSVNARLTARP